MSSHPKVYIIILNWNGLADTSECLQSLQKISYSNYQAVIVDNGSNNDEGAILQQQFSDYVNVIQNKENLGFSGGNNAGIKYALQQSDVAYILLLNNDTVVTEDFLTKLIVRAESNPKIGVVGPKIITPGGDIQPECARNLPTLWDHYCLNTFLNRIWRRSNIFNHYYLGGFDRLTPRKVELVLGAGMLIKKEVFDRSGMLDERFFLCGEDVDFCRRVKENDYSIYYEPRSVITHKVSQSMKKRWYPSLLEGFINDYRYYQKHDGRGKATGYRFIIWLTAPGRFLLIEPMFLLTKFLLGKQKKPAIGYFTRLRFLFDIYRWRSLLDQRNN
ncbi:glycosyltransferase family 2 protein [Patescibacteria group bacterium]|nr:glycosyltransferase family 2 protein [Patescibacteria group bacterium]